MNPNLREIIKEELQKLLVLGNLRNKYFSVGGSMGYQESTMKRFTYQNILMNQRF
jgi:hypothetical protein